MQEVGPGGHFFGAEHTQSRYRTAFHKPMLSDWRNYETWQEAGSPELPAKANRIWKELLAAYEPPPMDPAIARGARGVRRPPGRRGRRPDRLLKRPRSRRGPHEVIGPGRRHRWRRRRRQRAVPPDEGGLDRRRAPRAARADGGLDLARGRRDAHPQRRPERLQAPAVHDPAVRGDRADLRPGLLDPPAGRADAGRHGGPDGLPADGPGARPLPRDGPRAHLARRRPRTSSRCSTRSTSSARCTTRSRATSTRPASPAPTSSPPSWPAPRSTSTRRSSASRSDRTARGTSGVESGDAIHAEHVVNAGGLWAREVGRMVGHRAAGARDGAPLPAHRGHARGRRARREDRPRDADGARLRAARSTSARRAARCCSGTYEQACVPWSPRETPWDFGSQLLKPDLDRITPELQVAFKHYPAMAHDRHPAGRQRAVHVLTRRQSAGRADPRPARLLGRLRGDGRAVAGRRRRARARHLDDRRRPRRFGHGYLGHGRRPLRRLRDARLHERQGPGELPAPVPDHVPQRGAARRPAAAHDADPRPADRRQRGVGRDLRARARAVVPGGRASSRRRTSPSGARTPGTQVAAEVAGRPRAGRA